MFVRTEAAVGRSPGWLVAEWTGHGTVRGMVIGFVYPGLVAVVWALAVLPTWILDREAIWGGFGSGLFVALVGGLFGAIVGGGVGLGAGLVIGAADLITLRRLHPSLLAGSLSGVVAVAIAASCILREPTWSSKVGLALLYSGPFVLGALSVWVCPIRRRILPRWAQSTASPPVPAAR